MSTIQENLDLQYENLTSGLQITKMQEQQRLREIFGDELLGILYVQGRKTYEEIAETTGIASYNNTLTASELLGLSHLTSLTTLRLDNNQLTSVGSVSTLTSLTYLRLDNNQLTSVGSVSTLTSLTTLRLDNNQLTSVGSVSNLISLSTLHLANNQLTNIGIVSGITSLTNLFLYNNQLTNIGSISALNSLNTLHLYINNFSTSTVNSLLSDARTAFDNGASFSGGIRLEGNAVPTGGTSNSDYVYLTGQGVSVTIQES